MPSNMLDGNMDTSKDFLLCVHSFTLVEHPMLKELISLVSVNPCHYTSHLGKQLVVVLKEDTCQEWSSQKAHFSCLLHSHMT